MTTPAHLMEALARRGVRFSARAGRLVVDAPAGVLTVADRDALRANKAAILGRLAGSPPGPTPPAGSPPEVGPTAAPQGPAGVLTPIYRLIQAQRDPADRRVATPKGPGRLWQVFAGRVGVVLDATPTKVTFFDDPRRVTTPWEQ